MSRPLGGWRGGGDPLDTSPLPDLWPVGEVVVGTALQVLGVDVGCVGAQHLPSRGPGVVASNHVGYLDFAFVDLAQPRPRRAIRFVARHEIFRHPLGGPLMRGLRQVHVDPHGSSRGALDHAVALLRAGELVGLHPEGTISPSFELHPAHSGAARMALATGAPLVPTAVWGSQRLLTKDRAVRLRRGVPVRVAYGAPWTPPAGVEETAVTQELMRRIGIELVRLQETYPDGQPAGAWWLPARLGGSAPDPAEAEARLAAQRRARARARAQERRRRST